MSDGRLRRRTVERNTRCRGQAIPYAHMLIWLDTRGINVRPCSNLRQKGLGGGREGASAIGVLVWRKMPFLGSIEILGLDEGEAEVRGGL